MPLFVAPNPAVEVSGAAIFASFIYPSQRGVEQRLAILAENGIENVEETGWYPLQSLLNAFRDVYDRIGNMTIFLIGRDLYVKRSATLPPGIGLKELLSGLDVNIHLRHRLNGKLMFDAQTHEMTTGIGHIRLTEFSETARHATVVSTSPYPSKLEEGYLTGLIERFRPADSSHFEVKEDINHPRKETGGDSTTFLLHW